MKKSYVLVESVLNHYAKFIPDIEAWRLSKCKRTKIILQCEADSDRIRGFIDYCGILRQVSELPEIRAEDSWLEEVSKALETDYTSFTEWLEFIRTEMGSLYRKDRALDKQEETQKVFERKESLRRDLFLMNNYHRAIPLLFDYQIDAMKAYQLKDHLDGPYEFVGLRNIIHMDVPLEDKISFVEAIKEHRDLLSILPPENLDAIAWIKEAKKQAENYFEAHHIELAYPTDFVLRALKSTVTPKSRADFLTLARLEADHQLKKPLFRLGAVYGSEKLQDVPTKISAAESVKLLLYGLISRRPERQALAFSYFNPLELTKARAYIERSRMPPNKLYSYLQTAIHGLDTKSTNDIPNICARNIIEKLKYVYLNSSSQAEGKSELRDLVKFVSLHLDNNTVFDSITAKMQDGTLYDLEDGIRLHCCTMISEDREKDEAESLYYLLDPFIGLVHIAPSLHGQYYSPIGAAILANTRTPNYHNVLLLDSFEGGEIFQRLDKQKSLTLASRGILGAAKDAGASHIVFNTNVPNATPKEFNTYIGHLLGSHTSETIELIKLGGNQLTSRKKRLLEAFQDKEKLTGPVRGLVTTTQDFENKLRYAC